MEEALKKLFAAKFGKPPETATALPIDGSSRKKFRLADAKRSAIGVIGPDKKENAAFLGFSRHFRRCGLKVPEIYAEDAGAGVYLEEDLGDMTLFRYLSENRDGAKFPEPVVAAYRKVVGALPAFQITAGKTLDYSLCYPRDSFDKQSMLWDLNYFKYYFLRLAKIPFDEQALEDDFEKLAAFLLSAKRDFFLYRDFQSRNVMLKDGVPYFIDYQGGRKGALQYDIASLLFDAKADVPFEVRDELLALYIEAAGKLARIDRAKFKEYYAGYAFIRIMQAMGTYGLRGFYERKLHFLQSIPYAIRNIEQLLRAGGLPVSLPALTRVFQRLVGSSLLRQFGQASLALTVRVQSFSYKNGLPADDTTHGGGYVFDCRALPNPGKHERFMTLTGQDAEVAAFLEKDPDVQRFLKDVYDLVDQTIDNYRTRNFTGLSVAFGCTGGQHRSVYCAERLAARVRGRHGLNVELAHREL